jgi:ribose-phosphate pyrophosphokinase
MSAVAILPGDAHPALAQEIAEQAALPVLAASIGAFADGETRIRIESDVRGLDVVLVQPTSTPTNERLMTLALLADAARCAGAARVRAVIPYFGYARQDVRDLPGAPRSAQLAARLLATAGVQQVIALELHSPALESAFPMPVLHLQADELMLPLLRSRDLVIVAPDAGGLKRAQRYAMALGTPLAAVAKTRTAADVAVPLAVLGEVHGRDCMIVDDMASTGGTVAGAAEALYAAGARNVNALFIHAVMAPGALERMRGAGVQELISTDGVGPLALPGVRVVATAPLFARVLAAG